MRRRFEFATVLLAVVLHGNVVTADMISYGDHVGTTVMFGNVTENTLQPGLLPFGAPTVVGDEISFDMSGFVRQADADPCTPFPVMSFLSGQLSMNVLADPGMVLDSVEIRIGGSHSVFGPDSFARASVIASNRNPSTGDTVNGMTFFQSAPTAGFGVNDGPWTGVMTLLLDSVSAVDFDLDAQLMAFAGTAAYGNSFVNAEYLSIRFNSSIVSAPEPGSAYMMVGGLGLLFTRKRRRRFVRAGSSFESKNKYAGWAGHEHP